MKKFITIVTLLTAVFLLAACGENEANQAYDAWVNNYAPLLEQATENFDRQITAASNSGDNHALLAAFDEFIPIVRTNLEQLTRLYSPDLSNDRRQDLATAIPELEEALAAAIEARDILADFLTSN